MRLGNLATRLLISMDPNVSVFHDSSLLVCRTTTRVTIAARVVPVMRNAIPRASCLLAVPSHALAKVAVVDDAVDAPLSVLAGHVASSAEAIAGVGDNAVVRVARDAFGVPCKVAVVALVHEVFQCGASVVLVRLVGGDAVCTAVRARAASCLGGNRDMLASRSCDERCNCSSKPNLKVDRGGHGGAALEQERSGGDNGEEAHDEQVVAMKYELRYGEKCAELKGQVGL